MVSWNLQINNLHEYFIAWIPNRPIDLLVPSASEQDAPNEANGRLKKPKRNRKKNGCKRNNGGVVASKGCYEVEEAEPKYSFVDQLGQGWTSIKEFVLPIFFNLTFNPLKWWGQGVFRFEKKNIFVREIIDTSLGQFFFVYSKINLLPLDIR